MSRSYFSLLRFVQISQELREADCHAFRKLLSGHEPEDNLTLPCPALLLVLEYLLNTVSTAVLLVLLAAVSSQACDPFTRADHSKPASSCLTCVES